MKKLIALLLCLAMVLSMVACGGTEEETKAEEAAPQTTEPTTEAKTYPGDEMSLTEILDGIYEGYTGELPGGIAVTEIADKETFEWKTFATYVEGYEAAVSESMMGAIAHTVVLVRVPEGTDVESVRAEIEQNHDPRQWICVEAEKTAVIAHNNTIMLVMSFTDLADTIIANFDALWA